MITDHTNYDVFYSGAGAPNGSITPYATLTCIVGEQFEVRAQLALGTFTGGVVSAPAGSSSAWSTGFFNPDTPGRFRVSLRNGSSLPITADLVAFPAATLNHTAIADRNFPARVRGLTVPVDSRTTAERRDILRRIVAGNFGAVTDAQIAGLMTDAQYAALSPAAQAAALLSGSGLIPTGLDWSRLAA